MRIKSYFKTVISCFVTIVLFITLANNNVMAKTSSACVTADVLNVREKPSKSAKKIGTLKYGNKVTVHKNLKSGWSQITYKKKKSYVATNYLTPESNFKKWYGEYDHGLSGSGVGASLSISEQTASSFNFTISEYGRYDSKGSWVYETWDLKGKAKIKDGVGYYNKNKCKITFDYTSKGYYYNKNTVYTDLEGPCKAGYAGDESRKLSKQYKLGYIKR